MEDGYDIAVVRLNRESNLTLPSIDKQKGEFHTGKLFTALDWGVNETGKYPNSLQMTGSLVHVERHHCKEFLGHAVKKHSICAGFFEREHMQRLNAYLSALLSVMHSLLQVILEALF